MSSDSEHILVSLFRKKAEMGAYRMRQPAITMSYVRPEDKARGQRRSFTRPKQPVDFFVNGTLDVDHANGAREIVPFRIGVEEKTTENDRVDIRTTVSTKQAVAFNEFCRLNHLVPVYIYTWYRYGYGEGLTRTYVPILYGGRNSDSTIRDSRYIDLKEHAKKFDEMLEVLIIDYLDVYKTHFDSFTKFSVELVGQDER